MNDTCQITIDNTEYYIPCDFVRRLDFIDGYLVNISSQSISFKSKFNTNSSYPYISCSSMSICNLRTSSNQSVPVRSNFIYNGDPFRIMNFESVSLFILILILGVKLLWKR